MRDGHLVLLFVLMLGGCASLGAVKSAPQLYLFEVEARAGAGASSTDKGVTLIPGTSSARDDRCGWMHQEQALHRSGIKLATYNIHALKRPTQVTADFQRLSEIGAWALQEVHVSYETARRKACPSDLAATLPAGRWYGACAALNPLGASTDEYEAQLILSRWPISAVEVWELDHDSGKRRVAVAATLDTPGGEILFVNADLQPSFFGLGHGSRMGARSLARRLAAHRAQRVIVAGDFNTTGNLWRLAGNTADVATLEHVMRAAGCAAMPPKDRFTETFRAGWLVLRLDHVFIRGVDCERWNVDDRATGSDHFPLWCQLRGSTRLARNADESKRRPMVDGAAVDSRGLSGGAAPDRPRFTALGRLDDN